MFGCCFAASGAAADPYLWPLENSKDISSGFCAYRDAHYHGGIDLSTGGVEGMEVRAADSGYVFRVSTDYWGYGKAVYLKLADGHIAVYGHLSRFNAAIATFVENEQYSLQRYKTNLFPHPDELPVQRGEVIGYTGQTGYGPPHLHFEIRMANNFPLNPLAVGVGYTDRMAPEFRGILVRPMLLMDPNARVEGGLSPIFYNAEKGARPGRFVIKKPIMAGGAVGLAVDCIDPTGYKEYSVVPRSFSVIANNLRFFEMDYDSLDFTLTRQIDLDYDFDWLAETGDRLHKLYRHPHNLLPWYNDNLGDGIMDPARPATAIVPDENLLIISATDAAGNEALLELTLVFNQPPRLTNVQLEAVRGQWHISGHAVDPDNYISRFALRHFTLDGKIGETIWATEDSVADEQFTYIAPGPFAGGEPLELIVTDRWGATATYPFYAPGGLQSELDPQKRGLTPAIADFVPGGLVIRSPDPDSRPADDLVIMEIQSLDRPLGSWAFFLSAKEFVKMAGENGGGQFLLSGDRRGLRGIARGPAEKAEGDVLTWPDDLVAVEEMEALTVFSADKSAWARFNIGDVHDGGFFRIRPYNLPRALKHRPSSMIYSFEPISVPFMQKVEIRISYADLAATVDDLALYALKNDRQSWKYLGRDVDPLGKSMTAHVWSFGPYALVADTLKPKIHQVNPARGGTTSDRRPEIICKIVDDLSGIDSDQDIKILLDGQWLIPEYDPETFVCRTRPRTDLELGKHTLEIFARDRVGHEDYFLRYFTVVKKEKK